MTQTLAAEELTALERLHLRSALQDAWQHQVRQVTLLALAMYDDPDAEEPTPSGTGAPQDVEHALQAARDRLDQLEAAMRGLDDGGYGHCQVCDAPIEFATLMADPLQPDCRRCGG
jgi:RNA polymerase-binding transcription factor DksA